jgi:hypothetical protein
MNTPSPYLASLTHKHRNKLKALQKSPQKPNDLAKSIDSKPKTATTAISKKKPNEFSLNASFNDNLQTRITSSLQAKNRLAKAKENANSSKKALNMNLDKRADYETIITNIYLNSNGANKEASMRNRAKSNSNSLARPATTLNGNMKSSSSSMNRSNSSAGFMREPKLAQPITTNHISEFSLSSARANPNSSNVYIQRHASPYSAEFSVVDEPSSLSTGLKSLAIRQQERIYSAGIYF